MSFTKSFAWLARGECQASSTGLCVQGHWFPARACSGSFEPGAPRHLKFCSRAGALLVSLDFSLNFTGISVVL